MRIQLKVHTLGRSPSERAVGLEIVVKGFASYQMIPVTLTGPDAVDLARLLEQASVADAESAGL